MAGNSNSGKRKDKLFHTALMLELTAAETGRDLRAIAKNVISIALDKEHKDCLSAAKEVADRIDGKVPQAVVGDDDHPGVFDSLAALLAAVDGKTRSV